MKNKILKTLGVGALCLTGALAFAGCSDINLTQQQIDKIMYVVDQSDGFMDQVVDLMEKQTNKLNKEEAFDLYKLSVLKLSTNQDKILNNLKIEVKETRTGSQNYSYNGYNYLYEMTDGTKIDLSIRGNNNSFEIKYSTGPNGFVNYDRNGDDINKTAKNEVLLLNRNEQGFYAYSIFELSKDDIARCDILENGNVKIYYTKTILNLEDGRNLSYMTGYATVSKDCMLLEENFCIHYMSEGEDYYYEYVSEDHIKYSYGVIADSDVESYLNEAKNYNDGE